MKRKRPFRLERDPITGLTRAVDFEYSYNNFKDVEMLYYYKDLAERKKYVDLHRVMFSGPHHIREKTKKEKRLDFERGTFNEIDD